MPTISSLLESDNYIEALLDAIYGEDEFKRLSEEEIGFVCDCSAERFLDALACLPKADLQEMKDDDKSMQVCKSSENILKNACS